MELMDHTAVITGGTAGIGLESARLFASEGATVIVSGRDPARGAHAVEVIGPKARFIQTDMADIDSVNSLVQQCGEVDIIVNNAGSFPSALTVEQGMSAFETMFDTNVRGAYFLVAGLVPECSTAAAAASSTSRPWPPSREFPVRPATAPPRPRWNRSPAPGPPNSEGPGCG